MNSQKIITKNIFIAGIFLLILHILSESFSVEDMWMAVSVVLQDLLFFCNSNNLQF